MTMKTACSQQNCTMSITKKCLFGSEISACEFAFAEGELNEDIDEAESGVTSVENSELTTSNPEKDEQLLDSMRQTFHSGWEMGLQDANSITQASYTHLIGIIGDTDSGKTCFLTALYLMCINRLLAPKYMFAGSLTLPAWEDRARLWRTWNKKSVPKRISNHTIISDDRSVGLLHLCIKSSSTKRNLLFTDLPGEWTNDIIDNSENCSRLGFLRRADVLLFVINGTHLLKPTLRNTLIQNVGTALQRLQENVLLERIPPIVLLVTRLDKMPSRAPAAIGQILNEFSIHNVTPHVVFSASYSTKPDKIAMGTGIMEVLDLILKPICVNPKTREINVEPTGSRFFSRYRYSREQAK